MSLFRKAGVSGRFRKFLEGQEFFQESRSFWKVQEVLQESRSLSMQEFYNTY